MSYRCWCGEEIIMGYGSQHQHRESSRTRAVQPASEPPAATGAHGAEAFAPAKKAVTSETAAPPEETDRAEGMARALEGLLAAMDGPFIPTSIAVSARMALAAYRSSHPAENKR